MKQLGEVLLASATVLKERGITSFRLIAEELIAFVLQIKRIDLYLQYDRPLQEEELSRIRPLLKRLALREPLDYVLGEVSFYHTRLSINSSVLIPRPETEILVDRICKQLGADFTGDVWDLCTGSGCIGIAIKKACPRARVILSDLSEKAADLACANAIKNAVVVEVFKGNLLEPFVGRKADVIVCNPPYISEAEYVQLDASVREFEPKLALVGGVDGLMYYQQLKEVLPHFLNPGAQVFFEIGKGQGESVMNLYTGPLWVKKRVEKDWAGHDRFFFLEFDSRVR